MCLRSKREMRCPQCGGGNVEQEIVGEDTGSRKLDNNEDEMKTFEPSVLSRLFMMWVLPCDKILFLPYEETRCLTPIGTSDKYKRRN